MKFSKFSLETVSELLVYLADHEKFNSLSKLQSFNKSDVTQLFRELADNINEQAKKHPVLSRDAISQKELTDNTHKVIGNLSPQEENILFKSFRIS